MQPQPVIADPTEFITLAQMIKELKLWKQLGEKLKIKPTSARRQVERIRAHLEGKQTQKRTGKKRGQEYIDKMRETLEEHLKRPVITQKMLTPRQVVFRKLDDALRYTEPISHVSNIRYEKQGDEMVWVIQISPKSTLIFLGII
jgi:hypothetical protein